MNNNLSQQLCELCGIEPVIDDSCKISDRYWKNSHKIKGIHDDYVQRYCPCDMECTSECKYFYEKRTYPDFTKSANFVRLLEILSNYMYDDDRGISITKNTVILGDPICLETDESEKELNIMQKVLKLLLDGLNEGFESDKKFKQSIREAERIYKKLNKDETVEILQVVNSFEPEIPF